MKLYLVRHGQTDLNKVRRFQGRIDVPLNETGREQAQKLSLRLSSEPLDKIFASPLSRAQQTAEIIRSNHQIDITASEDLVEMSFGSLEGKTFQEINGIYTDWDPAVFDFTFAGGENLGKLVIRMKSFLDMLKKQDENSQILVVSHSGGLRVMLCLLLGIDVNKWWQFKIDVASLSIVSDVNRGVVLNLLNDTSHLNMR